MSKLIDSGVVELLNDCRGLIYLLRRGQFCIYHLVPGTDILTLDAPITAAVAADPVFITQKCACRTLFLTQDFSTILLNLATVEFEQYVSAKKRLTLALYKACALVGQIEHSDDICECDETTSLEEAYRCWSLSRAACCRCHRVRELHNVSCCVSCDDKCGCWCTYRCACVKLYFIEDSPNQNDDDDGYCE